MSGVWRKMTCHRIRNTKNGKGSCPPVKSLLLNSFLYFQLTLSLENVKCSHSRNIWYSVLSRALFTFLEHLMIRINSFFFLILQHGEPDIAFVIIHTILIWNIFSAKNAKNGIIMIASSKKAKIWTILFVKIVKNSWIS